MVMRTRLRWWTIIMMKESNFLQGKNRFAEDSFFLIYSRIWYVQIRREAWASNSVLGCSCQESSSHINYHECWIPPSHEYSLSASLVIVGGKRGNFQSRVLDSKLMFWKYNINCISAQSFYSYHLYVSTIDEIGGFFSHYASIFPLIVSFFQNWQPHY